MTTVLLPLVVAYASFLVGSFLPLYKAVFNISWLMDDFNLVGINLIERNAHQILELKVTWKHVTFIGGRAIYPHPEGIATSSTMMWHALQIPLTALVTVFVWPLHTFRKNFMHRMTDYMGRLVVLAPLLLVAISLDMPIFLSGGAWNFAYDALSPGSENVLTRWMAFSEGGGHFAVGALLALTSIYVTQYIQKNHSKTRG